MLHGGSHQRTSAHSTGAVRGRVLAISCLLCPLSAPHSASDLLCSSLALVSALPQCYPSYKTHPGLQDAPELSPRLCWHTPLYHTGAVSRVAPELSTALLPRSLLCFAVLPVLFLALRRCSTSRCNSALFRATMALFFLIAGGLFHATTAVFFMLRRSFLSRPAGGLFYAAPVLSFLHRRGNLRYYPAAIICGPPGLFLALHGCSIFAPRQSYSLPIAVALFRAVPALFLPDDCRCPSRYACLHSAKECASEVQRIQPVQCERGHPQRVKNSDDDA